MSSANSNSSNSSNQMLTAVLASIGEAVIVVNPEERTIDEFNKAAEQLFGYTRQELIGQKTEILHIDREHFERFGELSEPVLERGEIFQTEYRMRRKDGTVIDTYNTVSPIHEDMIWQNGVISVIRDITHQKETERQLKQERNRLYEAQRIGGIGDWTYDVKTGKVTWNPMMFEIFERDHESGPPEYEKATFYYGSMAYYHNKMVIKAIQENKSYSFDLKIHTEKGNEKWVHIEGLPETNDEGEVIKLYGIVQDITSHKEAEEQLKQQVEWFNQLFNNEPEAVVITDPKGKIYSVNPAFERLFGYSKNEAINQHITELLSGDQSQREHSNRMQQKLMKGEHFFEETIRTNKQGQNVDVMVGGACIKENGEITTLFFIYTDITEQKKLQRENKKLLEQEQQLRAQAEESREKFKEMVQLAPSAIALTEGPEHRFTYVNERFCQLYKKTAFVGRTLEEVFPEAREQGFIDIMDKVYENGEPFLAQENPMRMWDELNEEWYDLNIDVVNKPITDERGVIYGIYSEVVDVTDKVRYRNSLENKLEEKKTLLKEINHRVKNNLALSTSLLYMQMQENTDKRIKEPLKDAYSRLQSIALVHERLYQQAETNAYINLQEYLPQLIESIQQITEKPDKDISSNTDAETVYLPLNQAVPTGLLISELLVNAYKHAFNGREKGEIEIAAWKSDRVYLRISDDGIGLPEDFNMESNSMGMQIINTLIKQLQAELDYESNPGKGTSFLISYELDE